MKVKLSFDPKAVISSLSKLNFKLKKTSFTKDTQFGILFEIITLKVKVKLSFGHKTVISSLSKLNIEFKKFFWT